MLHSLIGLEDIHIKLNILEQHTVHYAWIAYKEKVNSEDKMEDLLATVKSVRLVNSALIFL